MLIHHQIKAKDVERRESSVLRIRFEGVTHAEERVADDMVGLRDQRSVEHLRPEHVAPARVEELVRGLVLAWCHVYVGVRDTDGRSVTRDEL